MRCFPSPTWAGRSCDSRPPTSRCSFRPRPDFARQRPSEQAPESVNADLLHELRTSGGDLQMPTTFQPTSWRPTRPSKRWRPLAPPPPTRCAACTGWEPSASVATPAPSSTPSKRGHKSERAPSARQPRSRRPGVRHRPARLPARPPPLGHHDLGEKTDLASEERRPVHAGGGRCGLETAGVALSNEKQVGICTFVNPALGVQIEQTRGRLAAHLHDILEAESPVLHRPHQQRQERIDAGQPRRTLRIWDTSLASSLSGTCALWKVSIRPRLMADQSARRSSSCRTGGSVFAAPSSLCVSMLKKRCCGETPRLNGMSPRTGSTWLSPSAVVRPHRCTG